MSGVTGKVKIAAVQLTSLDAAPANLARVRPLLAEAAAAGAAVVVLPENVALMGRREADKLALAEDEGDGPLQSAIAAMAREFGLWVIAGTLPLRAAQVRTLTGNETEDEPSRVAAASLVFDAQGKLIARYDKVHLFDVEVERDGTVERYRESASIAPGSHLAVVDTPAGRLGLSVCYDLRFPELYRELVVHGAQGLIVPAAFTVPTGRAHWEVLLRARAIENLSFVVAAGQWGRHASGRETYGDSMIIDHWGNICARLPEGEGIVCAEIDLDAQVRTRAEFPALGHRRVGVGVGVDGSAGVNDTWQR